MFRSRLLLIALLGSVLQLAAAPPAPDSVAAWKRLTLKAGSSVEMPANTDASRTASPASQAYDGSEQEAIYVAVASLVDSTESTHPDGHLDAAELDELYEHSLKDFAAQDAATRVLGRTPFTVAGQRGLEVQLQVPATAQLGTSKIVRILYLNRCVYLLIWRNTADALSAAGAAGRARFFNSLQVKAAPPAKPEVSDARQAGRTTGRLLVYGAVLACIIMLVRRSRAAKKHPQP